MQEKSKSCKQGNKLQKIRTKEEVYLLERKNYEQELRNLRNEEQQPAMDPMTRKGIKEWDKLERRFWKSVTHEDAMHCRNLTTSSRLLTQFTLETCTFLNYQQQLLECTMPELKKPQTLSLTFCTDSRPKILAVYSIVQQTTHSSSTPSSCSLQLPQHVKVRSNHRRPAQLSLTGEELGKIKLELCAYCDDEQLIEKYQQSDRITNNSMYIHEIDQQLAIWEAQLKDTNNQSTIRWNKLIKSMMESQPIPPYNMHEKETKVIQEKLFWVTILRYFEQGFFTKTFQMLEEYKENQRHLEQRPKKCQSINGSKFVETDCKICFSSYNSESNLVLYCDKCFTSFHLACYGLETLPQDEDFFCEKCEYVKEQQKIYGAKMKNISCQICGRPNFPMKKLGTHFYHVTCLILLNLVEYRDRKLALAGSKTHIDIVRMVVENELQHGRCEMCTKKPGGQLGYQFACEVPGCSKSLHPICAYISGCTMNVHKTACKQLEVSIRCRQHSERVWQQAYIRQYMCNLRCTSQKDFHHFIEEYKKEFEELREIQQEAQKVEGKYGNRTLLMSRHCQRVVSQYLKPREKKQQIATQSQQMLQAYKNRK